MMRSGFAILPVLAALIAASVQAQNKQPLPTASTVAPQALSDGEVRRIDRQQGKVTLKHGEIKSLEMPPMTMVFQVKDTAMLDRLKVGDKIRFTADQIDGALVLTRIETGN
jgi:Cu/Ag efflux protein CusF